MVVTIVEPAVAIGHYGSIRRIAMPVTRINHFEARRDSSEKVHTVMQVVVAKVRTLPGCRSARLLRSTENPDHLAVVEEWDSIEAHKQAATTIPPSQLEQAKALVARPPVGEYYQ